MDNDMRENAEAKASEEKELTKKQKFINETIEWVKSFVFAIVVAFLLTHFVIMMCKVPTGSMEPTVETGARLMVSRLNYKFTDPERGDIVTFYYPDDGETIYLKRIMGLPGETIEGHNGVIYVDGQALKMDYTLEPLDEDFGPFHVPENSYFMMGDNRTESWDARFWRNTYVSRDEIIGQAVVEFFPSPKMLLNTRIYTME